MNWTHLALIVFGILGSLARALMGLWKAWRRGEEFDKGKFLWSLGRGALVGLIPMLVSIGRGTLPMSAGAIFEATFLGTLATDLSWKNIKTILAGLTFEQIQRIIEFFRREEE